MDIQTDISGTDRLARAVAGIAGLVEHLDDGELANSLLDRPGIRMTMCDSVAGAIRQAVAGNIGIVDTDAFTLSVTKLDDSRYLCLSDGWGEWIAFDLAAARTWLDAGVGVGVLTPSPSETIS